MKKVGIITILKVNNYGAELQSYALQKKLNFLGYDAEIIDYLYYKNPQHKREGISKPFYPYPFKTMVKELVFALKAKLIALRSSSDYQNRNKHYEDFHRKFNRLSAVCYDRFSKLYSNPPVYDAYCVGSDQVWNPRCCTNIEPYFLTFAPKGAKRFSYASSFGVTAVPDSAAAKYGELLGSLDNIGVRESSGVKLVEELSGRMAKLVLDPTLLLTSNEWREVEREVNGIPQKYVLVYELQPLPYIMALAKQIAKANGYKIVRICKDASDKARGAAVINIADAGPSEFVWLVAHASFVVTNSFHGTAFSVNFNKPFFCVIRRGKNNNSRQLDLLAACGLTARVVYDGEQFPDLLYPSIDFDAVNRQMDRMREDSCNYLITALDGKQGE